MEMKNGAQTVELIKGRRVILSSGVGKTNIDELKWLTETVLSNARRWKVSGWAYIADCSKMDPVTPAEGGELVRKGNSYLNDDKMRKRTT